MQTKSVTWSIRSFLMKWNFWNWMFAPQPESGTYLDEASDIRLLSEVGSGGFGSVSLVRQESTGKLFAAKKSLDVGADLATEINRCLAVRHRNVAGAFPTYYDDGDGVCYILTEFVEGPSVAQLLMALGESSQRLSIPEVAWIGREIALGLQAIHDQGFVHRDLSFNNVILTEGRPVIIDFGLAKEALCNLTGTLCGTPNFIAPEAGFASATPRSDIFSLGCILYFLHFQRPILDDYGRGIALDLRFRKKFRKQEEPLIRIIEKAIAFNPRDRFASARQLVSALKPLADEVSPDWWWNYYHLLYECARDCAYCEDPLPGRALFCPCCGQATGKSKMAAGYAVHLTPYPCDCCDGKNSIHWAHCIQCGVELS